MSVLKGSLPLSHFIARGWSSRRRATGGTPLALIGNGQALSWQVLQSASWSSVTLCITVIAFMHRDTLFGSSPELSTCSG